MKRHVFKPALPGLLAAIAVGGGATLAAAQDNGPADLGIAVKHTRHPRPGHQVFFTVTVTNRGPSSTTGFQLALVTKHGLSHPQVVEAPPDSVQTICPGPPGSRAPCHSRWIPPRCHRTLTVLSCVYSTLELTPPSGPSPSLTLVLKAKAGKHPHEQAVLSVAGSDDPNPANNARTERLWVRGPRHGH